MPKTCIYKEDLWQVLSKVWWDFTICIGRTEISVPVFLWISISILGIWWNYVYLMYSVYISMPYTIIDYYMEGQMSPCRRIKLIWKSFKNIVNFWATRITKNIVTQSLNVVEDKRDRQMINLWIFSKYSHCKLEGYKSGIFIKFIYNRLNIYFAYHLTLLRFK